MVVTRARRNVTIALGVAVALVAGSIVFIVAQSQSQSPAPSSESVTETPPSEVAVGRRGYTYDLYQSLAPGTWWRQSIEQSEKDGVGIHSMGASVIGTPTLTQDENAPSFQYSKSGWSTSANANTYGGSYATSSSVGGWVAWTTPAATKVGLRAFRTTNGGYAKVQIDGNAYSATMLPTAKDEVTAGRLAASALTSNGGNLEPGDRLYSSFGDASDTDALVLFAEDLSPAVHTVFLAATEYMPEGSIASRLYVSGGIYADNATSVTTPNSDLAPYATINSGDSVSEYAIAYRSDASAAFDFVGNRYGHEVEDKIGVTIDGDPVELADGDVVKAENIAVERAAHIVNPMDSAESVAITNCSWSVSPEGSLNVTWSIDWTAPGIAGTAYVAMLPADGDTFTRGQVTGAEAVDLVSDDNSVNGSFESDEISIWQPDGRARVTATLNNLDEAVDAWARSDNHAWLQDRIGGQHNNGYFQRVQSTETEPIAAGSRWTADTTYRAYWR